LLLTAILIAEFVACGNSKSRVFLGKWEGTGTTMAGAGNLGGMYQTSCKCQLDISSNGESFIIKNDTPRSQCDCQRYEGIYTLTPEGNLKGGPLGMTTMSFDSAAHRIAVSGGGGLEYLSKVPQLSR